MPRKPTRQDYVHIKRIEAERNKTLPPGSRWHRYWCAIFRGRSCDCDEGDGRERQRRPRPMLGGSSASTKKPELEDA